MMEPQSIFNLVASTVLVISGWFLREMWDAVKELRKDLHKIESNLPRDYVMRTELDKRMEHIETMFQRIYDKLDGKADKP